MSAYTFEMIRRSEKYGVVAETHEGGLAYVVDPWTRLVRFLVLGSDGGTFYVSERELTKQSAQVVLDCLADDGLRVVDAIVRISDGGLAPKRQPVLFALALAAADGDASVRRAALDAVPVVCRTGTDLFTFVGYADALRGWGRGLRRAVADWYERGTERDLIYQAIKYQQRGGWSHRDLLRLSHPMAATERRGDVYRWIATGTVAESLSGSQIAAMAGLRDATDAEAARIIALWKLPREAVPTRLLRSAAVWEALLADMPLAALIRNLGTMSKVGLLMLGSCSEQHVLDQLGSAERIERSRVHPMALLLALKTYARGGGYRSKERWTANRHVVDALDAAFYTAFGNVEPTNKRVLVAVDSSASMSDARIAGAPLSAIRASAAMALVTVAVEPRAEVITFDTRVKAWTVSKRQRLDDVMAVLRCGGGTDLSLPWGYAMHDRVPYDGIVVYTDSEDGYGSVPQARRGYRNRCPDVRECVVATTATQYSAVDGPLSLNVVGFDASTPQVVSGFLAGAL